MYVSLVSMYIEVVGIADALLFEGKWSLLEKLV